MQQAALDELPERSKKAPGWFTASEPTLRQLINARNRALNANHQSPSPATLLHLQHARAELQRALRRAQSDWVLSTCAPINDGIVGSRGSAVAWKCVSKLRAGLGPSTCPAQPKMRKADGTRATTPEENATVFAEHFEQLYGHEASYDPSVIDLLPQRPVVPGLDHVPTDVEIRSAVGRLNNSAPGDSGVVAPLFKALISTDGGFRLVRDMVHHFWQTGEVQPEWETNLLAILAKKGDLSLPGNYRGIMMLEVAYKIISILLDERLEPICESLDHEAQCGFRRERGTSDALFTVRQLIAKRREHGLETWILFIDLVKAFDRVPRELLWQVMIKYGVTILCIHVYVTIKIFNTKTKGTVKVKLINQGSNRSDISSTNVET